MKWIVFIYMVLFFILYGIIMGNIAEISYQVMPMPMVNFTPNFLQILVLISCLILCFNFIFLFFHFFAIKIRSGYFFKQLLIFFTSILLVLLFISYQEILYLRNEIIHISNPNYLIALINTCIYACLGAFLLALINIILIWHMKK